MSKDEVDDSFAILVKNIWKRFGSYILSVVLVIILLLSGLKYWHKHEESQEVDASILYQSMLFEYQETLGSTSSQEVLITKGNQLMTGYKSTVYAKFAGLLLASVYISNDNTSSAENALEWVRNNAKDPVIYTIASERLARVMIYKKDYQKAIKILISNKLDKNFLVSNKLILGEAYAKQNNVMQAKKEWVLALDGSNDKSMKNLISMKINNLNI
jgi:predicted negative regulator of RcsB-dependent stress response